MSVRVVRMQNGEDVIADVKEVRQGEDGPPLAYKLEMPYALMIRPPAQMLFEDGQQEEPDSIDSVDIEFQPFVPLSAKSYLFVPIPSVSFIYEAHENLIKKYNQLIKKDAEIADTEDGPELLFTGDGDGTGRGTESAD